MPSLDDGSYSGADTTVTVAGWGNTIEDGSSPDVMHSVDLTLLTNAQCETSHITHGYAGDLVDSMICAIGDLEGGEDSCQGDSGGPLFVQQALPPLPPPIPTPHAASSLPPTSFQPPSRPHRGGRTSSSAWSRGVTVAHKRASQAFTRASLTISTGSAPVSRSRRQRRPSRHFCLPRRPRRPPRRPPRHRPRPLRRRPLRQAARHILP